MKANRKHLWLLGGLAMGVLAAPAAAEEGTPDPGPPGLQRAGEAGVDEEVRQWLELQRSGSQAGSHPTLQGPAAERVLQQYLKSFENPGSSGS
jgi:hypothetical protein